jgi:NAD+ synthase (glutamine-hydrolysing)
MVSMGFDRNLVIDVVRRIDSAEYKRRQSAPILKVTTKAFGTGRRMPIVWRRNW